MLCRHGRETCEQCDFERHEASRRFDEHVARNLQLEREAIERRWNWQKDMRELYG